MKDKEYQILLMLIDNNTFKRKKYDRETALAVYKHEYNHVFPLKTYRFPILDIPLVIALCLFQIRYLLHGISL